MHLATKSSRSGQHKSTLFWVYKALQTDWVTPFLRPGLYILPVKSIFRIASHSIASKLSINYEFLPKKPIFLNANKSNNPPEKTLADLNRNQVNTNPKVVAEKILHRILPVLLGTPETWQTLNFKKHERISSAIF